MFESVYASQVSIACFAGLVLAGAFSDVVTYKIPNVIVLTILLLYPIYVLVTPGEINWPMALAVFAGAIVAGMVLFRFGIFGAGDAKLIAAILLWAGPELAPITVLIIALIGGLVAFVMITPARFIIASALSSLGQDSLSDKVLARSMPYGVALAVGGIFVTWVLMTRT
jgi:prepilin peptidase CpaA